MSLSNIDVCLRLGMAFLCGLCIGLERQINHSVAGIHTNVLVSVGSCLFIFVGYGLGEINSPSRIAAQIVTGTGFLGSGVIVKDSNNIKGLNTAATIWTTAAIGGLCGSGYWITGCCASMLISLCNFILREEHIKMCTQYWNWKRNKRNNEYETNCPTEQV